MQRLTGFNLIIVMLVLTSIGISVTALCFIPSTGSVVTVNKKLIIKKFAEDLNKHPMKQEKAQKLSKKFAKALKQTVEDYANSKDVVILDRQKVMGSGVDVTDVIMQQVIKTMRGDK